MKIGKSAYLRLLRGKFHLEAHSCALVATLSAGVTVALESKPFSFLQVSDVHLDSAFAGSKIKLPVSKRKERKQEILEALARVFEVAKERRVDAILIPGDLWDAESVGSQTVNQVIELCMSVKDTFIVISPGNHDYYSADSMYNLEALQARGMRLWPSNVHVFKSANFQTVCHPFRDDISFTGCAFVANVPVEERLLAEPISKEKLKPLNILLFHGSLDGYKGGDSGFPGKLTAPFSAQELVNQGFTYTAVGHYHQQTPIKFEDKLIGAYSGCLIGRGLDESGPRFCLFGSITPKPGNGQDFEVKIEPVESDKRRIVVADFEITGKTSNEVIDQVMLNLVSSGAREGLDIVYLRLTGRYPAGGEPTYVKEKLATMFYHLEVSDETRQDYFLQSIDERTTEGKFVAFLTNLKKEAEAAGGSVAIANGEGLIDVKTIEDAMYFGLDALKQKRISIKNAD